MASFIKIKRSTGTVAPASIQYGELAYTTGVGTHGNNGGKLFIGDHVPDPIAIGGRYYTDLLSIAPGLVSGQSNPTTPSNGFVAILDQNRKVDEWNVDNLTLDGNTLSSTNVDGDINIDPNGSGEIVVPDDTYLTFGTSKDTKIKYDEFTDNRLEVTGADWNFAEGVAISISDSTQSNSTTTGALVVTGGVGIGGSVFIASNFTAEGNVNLGNSSTDQINIVGNLNQIGVTTIVGGFFADAVGINSNTIYTRTGTGDKLFIDPYPDGLSNEGTVIIKGDLQVDGTTTTVNSVTVTSNNPIYVVGDNATTRTVTVTAASGNQLTIDSVAGINTSDVITGNNIPTNTIISGINVGTKVITLSNSISGTIDAQSQVTITQGIDTNDDRGIAFKYVSSGIGTEAVVKTGFFGYDDSTSRWTYVPDAGIAANVVTGTKGFLDIKGIYYQSGDFSNSGVVYFDVNGLMTSTVAPGAGINTSNYILTTDASGVPTWTDTIDGGMF